MQTVKGMFFAMPGMGKTTAIATGVGDPRLDPYLWLDFEDGRNAIFSKTTEYDIDSIDGKGEPAKPAQGKINYVRSKDLSDLDFVITHFERSEKEHAKDPTKPKYFGFRTLVIDNWSEVDSLGIEEAKQFCKKRGYKDSDGEMAGRPEYNRLLTQTMDYIRRLRDLDINLFITAHQRETKDEKIGTITYTPKITGQAATGIPGLLQLVVNIQPASGSDRKKRIFYFQPQWNILCVKDNFELSELGDSQEFGKTDRILPLILDGLGLALPPEKAAKASK